MSLNGVHRKGNQIQNIPAVMATGISVEYSRIEIDWFVRYIATTREGLAMCDPKPDFIDGRTLFCESGGRVAL